MILNIKPLLFTLIVREGVFVVQCMFGMICSAMLLFIFYTGQPWWRGWQMVEKNERNTEMGLLRSCDMAQETAGLVSLNLQLGLVEALAPSHAMRHTVHA